MTRDASGTREPGRRWDAGTGTQGGTREPGRRWDAGTGTQVGTGNRDAGGNREPGHRWEPGTGTQVGPKIFSDLKFELFLTYEKC